MNEPKQKFPDCPRCKASSPSKPQRVRAAGTFMRASCKKPIQRYFCKDCQRCFSEATLTREYRQRKRDINHTLYQLLASSVSMRRSAIIIGITRRTVERRLPYLALVAEDVHRDFLASKPLVTKAHFDDMESSIHTKLKPVSIPLVVEHPSRLILSFDVVSMPAKGKLASTSVKKYGKRADDRKQGWSHTLSTLKTVADPKIIITSDSHKQYPGQIKTHLPGATHRQVISRRACVAGQGELKRGGFDPIFSLNHTAAMFRGNVNRLIRKTWCTSKKAENLKRHMAIFVLWHNETILSRMERRPRKSPFKGLC